VMMELTRGGYSNPMNLPRSNLQRVGYQYEEETLYRLSWPMVDRPQDSEPRRQKLIDEIVSLELFFYDKELKKKSEWPTRSGNSDTDTPRELPVAIELILELKDWGRVRRLFRSTQSIPAEKE
ncbi:MAG: type II secretion system minor pseudopilin GspJ, partial [Candidatus Thiodiazotropha sp. (ex Lucinoma kastoroae)]|nr:type II secretion system minor pseudopilin GspJ [Candidatus Thiodiazotropha sp. (ex Lucinoma kastoroae)]